MWKQMLTLGKRNIHITKNRLCKSNIPLNYSNAEAEKILSVVNNTEIADLLARFNIGKTRATNLYLSRKKSGNIENIDQLLNVGGFSLNVLNKFCRSILNEKVREEQIERTMKPISRLQSHTQPQLSPILISSIHSFTSIYIGLGGLSWAAYNIIPNEMTKLTHWENKKLTETKNLYHLAAFMSHTLKDIPKTDFYVFENPNNPSVGSSAKINTNVHITQMIGMASVIAAEKSTLPIFQVEGVESLTMNVAFLRKFLFARLFKLYVGTERISAATLTQALVQTTNILPLMDKTDDDIQTKVEVDLNLKLKYSVANGQDKDFMGCSYLLGLAFLRLCLLKCPKSISLVGRQVS